MAEHNYGVQVVQLPLDRLRLMEPQVRDLCGGRPLDFIILGTRSGMAAAEPRPGTEPRRGTDGAKPGRKSKTPVVPVRGSIGRLSWDNDFNDVYVDGVHYELTTREGARYCIRYLVMMEAFDKARARHIEKEINKYVEEQAKREVIKAYADGNLRIHHYFNGPGNYPRLCKALVRAAGRNRCFFLQV